jgi:hypothetical protein
VAALGFNLDMDVIRESLFRGNRNVLRKNMKKLGSLIEKTEFRDSFKGVFMEKGYRINPGEIRKLVMLKDKK